MHRMFAQYNAFLKNDRTRRFLCTAVGVLAFFSLIPTAPASPIGNLQIAGCPAGGVNVTATSITWLGAPGGLGQGGYGCVATTNGGAGTSVTYNGGTLGPGVNGEIKSLIFGVTSGTDFMDFTGASNLIFDLSGFAAGSGTDCIGLTMLLQNCSIQGGPPSPFVLTLVSGGSGICPPGVNVGGFCQTNVLLVVNPSVVRDGLLPNSTWSGSFSTQISTMSPAQIEAVIKTPGGIIGSGEAGSFTISLAPTVPEPVTFVMIGAGLAGLGIMRKRKQRA